MIAIGKNPAFQFYPGDWSRDLEEHPLEIEGAWIRICCKLWWSDTRGELTRTWCQWAKILRVDEHDAKRIIEYIKTWKIGDVVIDCNGNVTVISRRMKNDEKERIINNERRMKHYYKSKCNAECNADVTPVSQRSSSSSSIKEKIYKKEKIEFDGTKFTNIPDELRSKWTSIAPGISIDTELTKAEAWLKANPKNRKKNYERFLNNWLSRAQEKAPRVANTITPIPLPSARKKPQHRCDKCDLPCDDTVLIRGMNVCLSCFRSMDPTEDKSALDRLGLNVGGMPCQKPH